MVIDCRNERGRKSPPAQARQYRWEPERVLSLLDRIWPVVVSRGGASNGLSRSAESSFRRASSPEPLTATTHGDDGWQRRTLSIQWRHPPSRLGGWVRGPLRRASAFQEPSPPTSAPACGSFRRRR